MGASSIGSLDARRIDNFMDKEPLTYCLDDDNADGLIIKVNYVHNRRAELVQLSSLRVCAVVAGVCRGSCYTRG